MSIAQAANIYTSGQFFGVLFVSLLGILLITNEYYHQTATTTFLTTPHRSRVVAAKLVIPFPRARQRVARAKPPCGGAVPEAAIAGCA